MDDHFGVAFGAEAMAKRGQLRNQRLIVVDLAVVDDHHATVLVVKRLLSGGHVDDGQAAMPEAHAGLDMQTALVGPAVMLGLVDTRQQFSAHVPPAVQVEYSNDPAHDS